MIPVTLNRDHQGKMPEVGVSTDWLDRMAAEATVDKLAEGTRESYDSAWNQWVLWRQLQRKSPYLTESNFTERKANEDELLRFVTYLAVVMKRANGTIKQRIFAIRYGHLSQDILTPRSTDPSAGLRWRVSPDGLPMSDENSPQHRKN